MRIDNYALNLTQALGQTAQAQGSQGPNPAGLNGDGDGDSVQLSGFAQMAMGDSPKLQHVAADYSARRYSVSPQQIAASMIGEMMAG